MPDYRRWRVSGGTYFFTLVTAQRIPILTTELGRQLLRLAIDQVKAKRPFQIEAMVLMPDHLHAVWSLPQGDADYSLRWSAIKEQFTRHWLKQGGPEAFASASRRQHRERGIWQRRFWEHTCQDTAEIERAVDYIHWNPCKHGLVKNVREYPWSTFQKFMKAGQYPENWGHRDPCPDWHAPEWD
jgi:putative transposase